MHYIQTNCPKCNNIIKPYSTRNGNLYFANVFTECPHCKSILKNGEKEYINSNIITYIIQFIKTFVYGFFYGFMLWGIYIAIKTEALKMENNIILDFIILLLLAILCISINFYAWYKFYKEDKQASIDRLRDEKYLNDMLSAKIITQKQYNKFKEKYYINTFEIEKNSKKFCTKCGKEVNLDWDFCNYCGNKLK